MDGTSMPMSRDASRPTESPDPPSVAPLLTHRPVVPAQNPVNRGYPGENRSWSVSSITDPVTPPPHLLHSFADSFSPDNLYPTLDPQSADPFNPPTSLGPTSTASTHSLALFNPLPTSPEQSSSKSTKRPRQEPNDATDYNPEAKGHPEGIPDDERETGEQLATLRGNPKDHPAFKELERRIQQSRNDQDRWEACLYFQQCCKSLKEHIYSQDNKIGKQRRKLEQAEAELDERDFKLDDLIMNGVFLMQSKCERFTQIQQFYRGAGRKRSRDSDYVEHSDLRAMSETCADFLDYYSIAIKDRKQRKKALESVSERWGDDIITYYRWDTRSWAFCRTLKAAAITVPVWTEAGIKLNRIRNRRDRGVGNPIAAGTRSLSWGDFDHLRSWNGHGDFEMGGRSQRAGDRILPYARLAMSEFNPERLGFDKFGILGVKTTGSDDEAFTFSEPPWGIAQSPGVSEGAEERTEERESLISAQDGDAGANGHDETPSAIPIRGSARLRAGQPTSYSNQSAPIKRSSAGKRPTGRGQLDDSILAKEKVSGSLPQGAEFLQLGDIVSMKSPATQRGQSLPVVRSETFCAGFEDNEEFRKRALDELGKTENRECWGAESSRCCRQYLSRSSYPIVGQKDGPVDAHFSTLKEAEKLMEKMTPRVPIFTRCSNVSSRKAKLYPIMDYLTQAEKPGTKVAVQKYCIGLEEEDSHVTVTFWEMTKHLLRRDPGADGLNLWNALDLRNHLEHRHLPEFLRNNNCSLLSEIRQRVEDTEGVKWADKLLGKDPRHFALIADGGMNTYPHTDSHGYSTFLTVQEGELIFGWLSRPDTNIWDEWAKDPRYFQGGRWCYLVLKPGDSVCLPAGIPHYVVRNKGAQTFILGGHLLQWSNMKGWVSLLRKQIDNPSTTNEHMDFERLKKFVGVAENLVAEAIKSRNNRLEYLGGIEGAGQTLEDLKVRL
ncbi:Transcription factor jumonji aspartyl beta-hydroxylase [Fusarium albosuccineum]|uniref:Transcription factor jumonji aspartyl beta-hydroxylase n=1 Tax=Fusarium albosuccineum TaxID=1237068 RepID=A0A8H4L7Y7_9HYPO|nr:Transcription factor jumonji aspartyl beta-hydroxylase [Fusarium albosuccineum]